MERIYHGLYVGDFAEEATRLLGLIPDEFEAGRILRALWVLADPMSPDPTRYWTLSVGQYGAGEFVWDVTVAFPQGFPGTPFRVDLGASGIRVPRGSLLALRATPSGPDLEPLSGVSVVPEYAETSSRVG